MMCVCREITEEALVAGLVTETVVEASEVVLMEGLADPVVSMAGLAVPVVLAATVRDVAAVVEEEDEVFWSFGLPLPYYNGPFCSFVWLSLVSLPFFLCPLVFGISGTSFLQV